MAGANNFTALPTLGTFINDAMWGTFQVESSVSGNQHFQNLSRGTEQDEQADIPNFLQFRVAVITCVIIGLFIIACASYTAHKKCTRTGRGHKYYKAMLL